MFKYIHIFCRKLQENKENIRYPSINNINHHIIAFLSGLHVNAHKLTHRDLPTKQYGYWKANVCQCICAQEHQMQQDRKIAEMKFKHDELKVMSFPLLCQCHIRSKINLIQS